MTIWIAPTNWNRNRLAATTIVNGPVWWTFTHRSWHAAGNDDQLEGVDCDVYRLEDLGQEQDLRRCRDQIGPPRHCGRMACDLFLAVAGRNKRTIEATATLFFSGWRDK